MHIETSLLHLLWRKNFNPHLAQVCFPIWRKFVLTHLAQVCFWRKCSKTIIKSERKLCGITY